MGSKRKESDFDGRFNKFANKILNDRNVIRNKSEQELGIYTYSYEDYFNKLFPDRMVYRNLSTENYQGSNANRAYVSESQQQQYMNAFGGSMGSKLNKSDILPQDLLEGGGGNDKRYNNYSAILYEKNKNTDGIVRDNEMLKYQDMMNKMKKNGMRQALSNPLNVAEAKMGSLRRESLGNEIDEKMKKGPIQRKTHVRGRSLRMSGAQQNDTEDNEQMIPQQFIQQPAPPQNIIIVPSQKNSEAHIHESLLLNKLAEEHDTKGVEQALEAQTRLIEELVRRISQNKQNKSQSEKDLINQKIAMLESDIMMKRQNDDVAKMIHKLRFDFDNSFDDDDYTKVNVPPPQYVYPTLPQSNSNSNPLMMLMMMNMMNKRNNNNNGMMFGNPMMRYLPMMGSGGPPPLPMGGVPPIQPFMPIPGNAQNSGSRDPIIETIWPVSASNNNLNVKGPTIPTSKTNSLNNLDSGKNINGNKPPAEFLLDKMFSATNK